MNLRRVMLFLAAGCLLAGCQGGATPERLGSVPDFQLIERSGRPVSLADLKGKVWVASFVFTRCTGPCPQITGSMAQMQDYLANHPGTLLVTFTVDPDHDAPAVLKSYADKYHASPTRWLFLTGDRVAMYRLIETGFKLGVAQNQGTNRAPGNEVMHSTRLVLVDRRGDIRGYFDGTDQESLAKLRRDIVAVAREAP